MITPLPSLYYLDYGVTWHLQCIHDLDYHVMMPPTTQIYVHRELFCRISFTMLAVAAIKSTAGVFPTYFRRRFAVLKRRGP